MFLRALSLGVVILLASGPLAAQQRQHAGFWLGVGAGGGWLDGQRGAAGYLRMGGPPEQRVLFGGEIIGWTRDEDGVERSQGSLSAVALFYPFQRNTARRSRHADPSAIRGFFLKAGFGAAGSDVDGDTDREGLALTLGTGFDFRLGRNFYVTPNVDFLAHFFREQTDTALLVTLGFTWH